MLTGVACSLVSLQSTPLPSFLRPEWRRVCISSRQKSSFQRWVGGQARFLVELAIFQLLKQPPLLEENMRKWKQEKWDVYQICKSNREGGMVEKLRRWTRVSSWLVLEPPIILASSTFSDRFEWLTKAGYWWVGSATGVLSCGSIHWMLRVMPYHFLWMIPSWGTWTKP